MNEPKVEPFFDPNTSTFTYIVWDSITLDALIFDPVLDYDAVSGACSYASANRLLQFIDQYDLKLAFVFETHVHADHLSASAYLKETYGCKSGIGCNVTTVQTVFSSVFNTGPDFLVDGRQFDLLINDGDSFQLGNLTIEALHTPGHTPACTSFIIGNNIFVGDTLFMPDFGTARTDFPGGNAQTLYHSIQKIYSLADTTNIFLCHDYGSDSRPKTSHLTTVGAEKADNIHIAEHTTESDFVNIREARDAKLAAPKLLYPAIQFNMRGGRFPPSESNHRTYFKIPLTLPST